MKKLLFVLGFVIVVSASAQDVLNVKMQDSENGKPVFMARVNACGALAYSDKNGHALLQIPSACDNLLIEHPDYETRQIKHFGVQDSIIRLVRRIVELNEVVFECEDEVIVSSFSLSSNAMPVLNKSMRAHSPRMEMSPTSSVQHTWYRDHQNNEAYSPSKEQGYSLTERDPMSTFSTDVDVASYSRVRRFLNDGMLPPKDAVRVEEMINYFSYDYPQPKQDKAAGLVAELGECPWNADHRLLRIAIKAKELHAESLPPSNFVFLVDVSGSMHSPDKLPMLQAALKMFVKNMRPNDKLALVSYAGSTRVVLESTLGRDKQAMLDAIDGLNAGGSTAGASGLSLAYREAEKNFLKDGNNRIILATDGDFNVGPSSVDELIDIVKQKRDKNIFMSVIGFGTGNLKDDRMEAIADNGNGNYAYIDNLLEANKVLVKESLSTLYTVAKDAKIQVEFNPANVSAYRLIGYENRLLDDIDFNDDKKDAGDLGAGHTVTALYEIVPVGSKPLVDPLRYSITMTQKSGNEWALIKLRYKEPEGTKSKYVEWILKDDTEVENSSDFKFAAAVAGFGMLLKSSDYVNEWGFSDAANLALKSKGNDTDGYRSEFIKMVEMAALLREAQN